ncbi:hypothetical protein ACWWJF_02160 [Symbiopectobacterium sp. Eva_TO]
MIVDVNRSVPVQPFQNTSATCPGEMSPLACNLNQISNNTEKHLPAKINKRRMAVSIRPAFTPKMIYQQQIGNIRLHSCNINYITE